MNKQDIVRSNECPVCGDDTGKLCQKCSSLILGDRLSTVALILAAVLISMAMAKFW